MKRLFFVFLSCLIFQTLVAQFPLSGTHSVSQTNGLNNFFLTKFTNAGYKYVVVDNSNGIVNIYNINHTAYKSFTFSVSSTYHSEILYLSDQLFDKNSNIEYILRRDFYTSTSGCDVTVLDENGVQLFYKDSALAWEKNGPDLLGHHSVIYNGTNYQLVVGRYLNTQMPPVRWEIYDLPGSLPCISCSTFTTPGVVTAIGQNEAYTLRTDPAFFPNPVHDQLKLKYTLPAGFKSAEIIITDLQGKTIEKYQIGSAFDFIYIPSDYNNGMYLYTLVVDGVSLKTEKIIISK